MVAKKKAIAILGMAFAVAGGVAWFFQQVIPAFMLWGVAVIILLKINQKKRKSST